jgi:hypothetical protein
MSTAEKLTYLNTTKTLIKDNLNLGGANISNEPFRVYSSKLIDIYKDFLANGTDTLWNNWNKVNGTGENLTLNNTIKGKMKIDLKGNTSQYSTTGKNLLKLKNTTSGGLTTTLNSDGSISVSGTATGSVAYLDTGESASISAGALALSIQSTLSVPLRMAFYNGSTGIGTMTIGAGKTSTTNTFSQEITNYNIYLYNLVEGTTYNFTIKPMLESGSSASAWEPYTNGASPNPDYPQDIHTVSGDNTLTIGDGTDSTTYPINLGSIELCKIGDYQDSIVKDNGKWYLEKKVRHLSLNISDMNNSDTYPGWKYVPNVRDDLGTGLNGNLNGVTDFYVNISVQNYIGYKVNTSANQSIIWLSKSDFNNLTQTQWKEQYPNLVVELYYGITPTYTKITDSTLINQLEAIKLSYNEQTNITQTNDDKPFILDVTALGELEI